MVMKLPILIIFCFVILFYYLGWSFMSGIVIFVITFYSNTWIAAKKGPLQKEMMRYSDARIKSITESLHNIRMLKLYSWTGVFANMISEKRVQELKVLWKRFYYGNATVTSLYFFPSMLSAVVFSVYIGLGESLSLQTAFTVLTVLDLIKSPLRTLPNFVGSLIEFQVAMTRIQNFILVSEVNPT